MTPEHERPLLLRAMRARDPAQAHRVATPLELFLDLCFVVAVAQASSCLHHGLAAGDFQGSIQGYAAVFYAIWWAWMNFTWFASAYDVDDVPYRLLVLLQIVGVLILAAGVPPAFTRGDFLIQTIGYVVMRVALLLQWLRAWRADPARRGAALRYAIGIGVCQIGWVGMLALPYDYYRLVGWFCLVPLELSVPVWAERAARTPWHPHHIAERYGLLTLIVLGESVLSATTAIQAAFEHAELSALIPVIVGAILIVFSMWWLYFENDAPAILRRNQNHFLWGYGHYLVFASAAAVGAGIGIAVDDVMGATHIGTRAAAACVAVPVAVFLISTWLVHVRPLARGALERWLVPLGAVLVLGTIALPWPVLLMGAGLSATVAARVVLRYRQGAAQAGN